MNDVIEKSHDIVKNSIRYNYICIGTSIHNELKGYEITVFDKDGNETYADVRDCTDAFQDVGEKLVKMSERIIELEEKLNKRW